MKKKNILLFILLCTCIPRLNAQVYFNNRYDISNSYDESRGIVEINGGYIIAGVTDPETIYLMFIDTLGNKKWVKTYQINGWPYSYCGFAGAIIKTKDDNIVVFGKTTDTNDYGESLLMKLNQNGDTIWTRTYQINYPNKNMVAQCKQTSDNGYVLAGIGANIPYIPPDTDFLIIKTDSNGVFQWFKLIGDNKIESAYSIIQSPDKGYLIGGIHYYNIGGNFHADPKIIKTDSMGNFKWDKLMGGIYDDNAAMVCMAKDSNYIVAYTNAEYETADGPYRKICINKLDTAGNIIWSKKYGEANFYNSLTQIKPVPDGGFLVCGFTDNLLFTFYRVGWLLRINANGDSLWYREYANYVHDEVFNYLWDMSLTKDKGIVAAGTIYPNSTGGTQDVWVIKTDSFGCLESDCTVGVTEIKGNKGMAIYPNPARDKITFQINPTDIAETKLVIYNIQGQILMQKNIVQNNTEIDV